MLLLLLLSALYMSELKLEVNFVILKSKLLKDFIIYLSSCPFITSLHQVHMGMKTFLKGGNQGVE